MGLIAADLLIDWTMSQRVTCFEGAQGSGKTLLAFKVGQVLIQDHSFGFRYLLSNCDSDITDKLEDIEPRMGKFLDTVIILDEIGKFINRSNIYLANNLLADMRKLNCVLLCPSRNETQKDLRVHVVEMVSDLHVIGLDAVIYMNWLDKRSSKNNSKFIYLNTNDIKGHYDTTQVVDSDNGIIAWLIEMKKQIQEKDYELKAVSEKRLIDPMENN